MCVCVCVCVCVCKQHKIISLQAEMVSDTKEKALYVRCVFIFKVCTTTTKRKKMEVRNISFVSQS